MLGLEPPFDTAYAWTSSPGHPETTAERNSNPATASVAPPGDEAARGGALDRYEEMGADFMARVAHGFHAIATSEPGRCALIDAEPPVETVVAAMRRIIRDRTGR